jgi:hypothetical protein
MLHAELKVLELEEKFVKAKASGNVTAKLRTDLREARRKFRELREDGEQAEGSARPAAVKGKSGVNGKSKRGDKVEEN